MAAPVKKTIELFYDVVSPYSWVAFEVLTRYQTRWNIDLRLRPFFLGGVMKETGNQPPGMLPAKAIYMLSDIERLKRFTGIPLKYPSDPSKRIFSPGASLPAARFLTAVDTARPDCIENVSRNLWLRVWARDQDISTPESIAEAGKLGGLSENEVQNFLEQSTTAPVKDRLKAVTEEACDKGAFGAPFVVAHIDGKEEMYFGSDRIELLAFALGEKWEGPLPQLNKAKL